MKNNKFHIVFLLPSLAGVPSGGVKVVLEYANRLVQDGFDVSVVYPASLNFYSDSLPLKIKAILRFCYYKVCGRFSGREWFNIDYRVKNILSWSLTEKFIPKGSHYIATGVMTSFLLDKISLPVKKYYLIQGYENWIVHDSVVIDSYRLNLKKIVISNWLKELIESNGEYVNLIPNGFNHNEFSCTNDICKRDTFHISMMYHNNPSKGFHDGFEAIQVLKQKYPDIIVSLFGVFKKPKNLPQWVKYYQNPSKETLNYIYNSSSIFIAPSHNEGWGLTIGESMMCGCAVVCTSTLGHLEMAVDNYNALIVPCKSPESISDSVDKLLTDDELRIRLALAALQSIKKYDWNSSYKKLKDVLDLN